ncbi:bifunctional enoyl-CoA hydratase/phosphate acetyltransferase [Amorphus coralli]|uniref:bifunctional enoyl-CoA hydratase/phosphate acetyltransferase n=1 Tax=Amorphus coralli TaxID=340680 RepID=UPI00037E0F4C|nr:bifunctional enoyl-CoA hydratase/phosphate acetyltransferase [Amorphus coralli]
MADTAAAARTSGERIHFQIFEGRAAPVDPVPTAVVCPYDDVSLSGALQAADKELIVPLLVGHRETIEFAAGKIGRSLHGIEIVEASDDAEAAGAAVSLVHEHRARCLMKGHLHTDTFLHPIVSRSGGLRAGRRLSHVFVMDLPYHPAPLLITDAAINIAPDLATKADIVKNGIDLAVSLGIERPKVAILSAVETVNEAIPSSVDAAILAKMSDRGQIKGGIVDGPFAMDNAIDAQAAKTKDLHSPVAGQAEVLVVPSIEAGNILFKGLTFLGGAESAGLVMGASVPIMLTSRADDDRARVASASLALLYDHWCKTHGPLGD